MILHNEVYTVINFEILFLLKVYHQKSKNPSIPFYQFLSNALNLHESSSMFLIYGTTTKAGQLSTN